MFIKIYPPQGSVQSWEVTRCHDGRFYAAKFAFYDSLADFIREVQRSAYVKGEHQFTFVHDCDNEEIIEDTDETWVELMLRYGSE